MATVTIEQSRISLALHEAFSRTYPCEPYPGIHPSRPYIARVGNAPKLERSDEQLLINLVWTTNVAIVRDAARETHEFSSPLLSAEAAQDAIIGAATAVMETAAHDETTHVVCPPAGAIPLARMLSSMGFPKDRIHAVEISGSAGTESGTASVRTGGIHPAVLNPNHKIIVLDDIGDSHITALALAHLRHTNRNLQSPDGLPWETLIQQMREAHQNHNHAQDPRLYERFAKRTSDENIIFLPVFSKNAEALAALSQSPIQQELFARYPVTAIDNVWVVGSGLLDTGVLFSLVRERLPKDLQNHTFFSRFINPLGEWLLRIGTTVPGLVYLDPKHDHEDHILDLISHEVLGML